jgi:hypothetical protein
VQTLLLKVISILKFATAISVSKNVAVTRKQFYRKTDLPPAGREITIEQALMLIRNQGYKIKSATT